MLPKAYNPTKTEDRIYQMWEDTGAFQANRDAVASGEKEGFSISLPPPNATGQLHLGHAVMLALEDIFIRFQRMQGKEALWVPGTDHASIATEAVVIRKIREEEGVADPRAELGREELLKRIHEYVAQSQGTIRSQVRKMGASCDWSRESYTMNPSLQRTTYEAFKDMYETGAIYRGDRIVNWDPKLQTTLSDDEVDYKEERAPFYTFQYGPFQIGTARPETKFGDKYVVMHPDDKRYAEYKHDDTFTCEWINGPIEATIIKDDVIDMEFGTGVMTITPWHSQVDFDMAQRHNLDIEQIIDFDGNLLPVAQEFEGMHISEAREKIVQKLEKKGLLVSVDEDYVHNIAISSRGGGIVEPQVKRQWFVDVNKPVVPWKGKDMSIKEVMQDVVRSGMIRIIPERFEKNYFYWIDNLRDWCISRQIWWGHRIPVYYCEKCSSSDSHDDNKKQETRNKKHGYISKHPGTFVSVEPLNECPCCGGALEQDCDTLDTWYGVAQWTWSPMIDPELAKDPSKSLKELIEGSPDIMNFHPTQVMETGYDILFFWVARMILMTTYCFARCDIGENESDRIPFETVYLHGLVRTREGKKMSKSDPSTCIDPLEIIPEFGTDALRMSMIVGQSPGNDFRLYTEKIAGYRNFINKLWNASRFVLLKCEESGCNPRDLVGPGPGPGSGLADRALLHGLQTLTEDVTKGLEDYRLSDVGERLYSFVWDYFCDWYLELSKGEANPSVLVHSLRTILILLHPYCPFVTEELWSFVGPEGSEMLLRERWPKVDEALKDPEAYDALQKVIDTISAIRKLRSEQGIEPGKKITVTINTEEWGDLLSSQSEHIRRMAKVESLTIEPKKEYQNVVSTFLPGIDVHVSLEGLIDTVAEVAKLTAEKQQLESYIAQLEGKLGNDDFVKNAPEAVVAKEKQKLEGNQEKLQKVVERLKSLS